MDKNILLQVGMWAESRVASGEEPPWTFYKLKQLSEIVRELADGLDASVAFEAPSAAPKNHDDANVVQISQFRAPKPEADVALPT